MDMMTILANNYFARMVSLNASKICVIMLVCKVIEILVLKTYPSAQAEVLQLKYY